MSEVANFDLHSHTTVSDGDYTPAELLRRASDLGIRTLSITDHDSVGAYTAETYEVAEIEGIDLLPGVEISTRDEDGYRFHILGLGIDVEDRDFLEALEQMGQRRAKYARSVFDLMREDGFSIEEADIFNDGSTITKATIADIVLGEKANEPKLRELFGGNKPSRGQFIEGMLLNGKPFYIRSPNSMHPNRAIDIIHGAGGLAILAHPVSGPHEGHDKTKHIEKILGLPLDGIEAFYVYYARSQNDRRIDEIKDYTSLAEANGLLVSAGSDFHTDNPEVGKFVELGFANETVVPDSSILDALVQALRARRP